MDGFRFSTHDGEQNAAALNGARSSFSHLRSVAKLKPRPSSVARVGTPALQSDNAGSRVDSEDVFSFETNSSAALKTAILTA